MTTPTPQRETAKICTVKDLTEGTYVVQEGWAPNYVASSGRKLSRVNIMGIVVEKSNPYEFMMDDGTGSILVTDFNQQKTVQELKVGEPVLVIGRPRQAQETLFIACEIAASSQLKEQPDWMKVRQQELQVSTDGSVLEEEVIVDVEEEEEPVEVVEKVVSSTNLTAEDILSFIKKKDSGDGCLIEEVVSYFGDEVDEHILTLITMGEIFEIKPGRVKVLE